MTNKGEITSLKIDKEEVLLKLALFQNNPQKIKKLL